MSSPPLSSATIALNRFGLGAAAGEAVPTDPKRFLLDQFSRFEVTPAGLAGLPDGAAVLKRYLADRRDTRQAIAPTSQQANPMGEVAVKPRRGGGEKRAMRRDYVQDVRELYLQAVQARMASAIGTSSPFIERMVHFWTNHFCVSADNPQTMALGGAFERDAIRPHVLGKFSDMLLAVEQHPAMLIYLNQAQSIGPDSPAARQTAARNPNRKRGLNENLGREIMELHTLGARSGYTQADVTEFARALTGWTVSGIGGGGGDAIAFEFRPRQHEPGIRTIMGRSYSQSGQDQGRAALADFAAAPQTADHVATKLARHFAGDTPPQSLIDRLATSFAQNNGDLAALYRVLIDSPETWAAKPLKFRNPWEWTVASLRVLGPGALDQVQTANILNQLGQPTWKPGSPAGWDDLAASWAAPDALLRRVEIAQRFASLAGARIDARSAGPQLLPGSLDPATAEQVARAESPATALALLLVSPDMLRR